LSSHFAFDKAICALLEINWRQRSDDEFEAVKFCQLLELLTSEGASSVDVEHQANVLSRSHASPSLLPEVQTPVVFDKPVLDSLFYNKIHVKNPQTFTTEYQSVRCDRRQVLHSCE